MPADLEEAVAATLTPEKLAEAFRGALNAEYGDVHMLALVPWLADLIRREREAAFDAGANLAGAVEECVTVHEAAEVAARIRRVCIEGEASDAE